MLHRDQRSRLQCRFLLARLVRAMYTSAMTGEALKDRLHERPFRGFGMRMPDGRLLPIPHPEFISIEPEEERTAIVWKGNGGYWTVDLELVSDLEPLKNNRGKRRH